MFYLFATTEIDKQIEPGDALLSRKPSLKQLQATAETLDGVETYIMNENDVVVWQSWPEEA